MANDPHNNGPSENIDVIRQLLQRLEEVAAKDGERPTATMDAGSRNSRPTHELATLSQRSNAVARPPAERLPDLPTRTIELAARSHPAAIVVDIPRRKSSIAIPIVAFVVGAGTALGIVVALDPFKQFLAPTPSMPRPPVVVAQPDPPQPVVPVQTTTAAVVDSTPPIAAPVAAPAATEAVVAPLPEPPRTTVATSTPSVAEPPAAALPTAVSPAATPNPVAAVEVAELIVPAPQPAAQPERPPEPVQPAPRTSEAIPVPVPAAPPSPIVTAQPEVVAPPLPAALPERYALSVPLRLELRWGVRQPFFMQIEPLPNEPAALLAVFRNVPEWLTFSKGSAIGNEIWLLPAHLATDMTAEVADGADGTAEIKVQLATADGRILAEALTQVRAIRGANVLSSPMVAELSLLGEQGVLRLMARAELLLDTGEVESARTLLRSAAVAGSVGAALKLAETYDPSELQRLGMAEAAANQGEAVRWYEHAQSLGSVVATGRLVALGRR